MKDSRELIYSKIKFFKSYILHILANGTDVYSKNNLVNLKYLMMELQSELVTNEYKYLRGLTYFLDEIKNYLQTNYFYKKTIGRELNQLISCFNSLENSNNESNYNSTKHNVIKIVDLILVQISEPHILTDLVNEIGKVIYNCEKLEDSYTKIQSLANDYTCEILLQGFDYEYIREELSKSTIRYENGGMVDKIEELFKIFLWAPIDNENNTYTFIFKIRGFKIYVESIKIEEVLFYNPIREDLLRWREKEDIFSDEIYIMDVEDQELLENYRSEKTKNDEDYYNIEYTNCHARIKINAPNVIQGLLRAKNKIDNLLQILKFKYPIGSMKISDLYLVYDHKLGTQRIDSITSEGKIRKSKLTEVSYYPRILTDTILKDLASNHSQLNNLLFVNNSPFHGGLSKVIYWYNKGQDESDYHVKFVNYWVALEYLVGQQNDNIKTKMLKDLVAVLVQVTFRNELRGLYSYFRNQFFGIGQVMEFPSELSQISGLSQFHLKVEPVIFAENLHIFKKYTDDDFVQYKIDFLYKLHTDTLFQKTTFMELEKKYKVLISRLYRIRNGLVHNALIEKNDIRIYVNWLKYCVVLILNASVLIDESKDEKQVWNYEYAIKIFNEWKRKINKGQKIDFF